MSKAQWHLERRPAAAAGWGAGAKELGPAGGQGEERVASHIQLLSVS
jgi:hypothetical protein